MTIGIYSIYWELQDLTYVGLSQNIDGRLNTHLGLLRCGTHKNSKLQGAYTLYGEPATSVLEECKVEELNYTEIFWISEFNSFHKGLNQTIGGEGLGYGDNNPNSNHSKETYAQVLKLSAYSTLTIESISIKCGVTVAIVKDIQRGHTHNYLEQEYPVDYSTMKDKLGNRNSAKCRGISYPIIVSPSGKEYNVENVKGFCETHCINEGNLHSVFTKKRKSANGWKLKESN